MSQMVPGEFNYYRIHEKMRAMAVADDDYILHTMCLNELEMRFF